MSAGRAAASSLQKWETAQSRGGSPRHPGKGQSQDSCAAGSLVGLEPALTSSDVGLPSGLPLLARVPPYRDGAQGPEAPTPMGISHT